MENIIEEYVPTTQELINKKLSRMLDIDSFLLSKDYLTHKSVDGNNMVEYGDFSATRDSWREEYNTLEIEVADLEIKLNEEQKESVI